MSQAPGLKGSYKTATRREWDRFLVLPLHLFTGDSLGRLMQAGQR